MNNGEIIDIDVSVMQPLLRRSRHHPLWPYCLLHEDAAEQSQETQ